MHCRNTVLPPVPLPVPLHVLPQVYSECPSYDELIPALLAHPLAELPQRVHFKPGVPVKPMLAKPTTGEPHFVALNPWQQLQPWLGWAACPPACPAPLCFAVAVASCHSQPAFNSNTNSASPLSIPPESHDQQHAYTCHTSPHAAVCCVLCVLCCRCVGGAGQVHGLRVHV